MQTLDDISNKLPNELITDHFAIRYGYRHKVPGKGLGVRGVRGQGMITSYVDGLERLHQSLAGPVFGRKRLPKTGSSGKVRVLVFELTDYLLGRDGTPFTAIGKGDVCTIALPCRDAEPAIQHLLNRATADAVHEATHVFNYAARERSVKDGCWEWFNEATAVFMESHVFPGNLESMYFHMDWADKPDMPLDSSGYQAAMFVEYLVRRYSPRLLTDIWELSDVGETPLVALERLRPGTRDANSQCLESCAVFADYCLHSYFVCDQNSHCFKPELYFRYGWRMIDEGFRLPSGNAAPTIKGVLDHLSCRYYRVEVHPGSNMECRLRTKGASQHLEAQVAGVRKDLRWEQESKRFLPTSPEEFVAQYRVTEDLDHVVIVVSNSSLHHDGAEFELQVQVA